MRLTQFLHHLNELCIPTIPQIYSYSQSPIPSMKNRIYRGTAVAHIPTNHYLLQIWLEMERWTWATYRLLRWSPTASQSRSRDPPSWSRVTRWEWSESDSEILSGLEFAMASETALEMVMEMVSKLEPEMASWILLESNLIGHVSFQVVQKVHLDALHLCLLFFVWNGRDSHPGGALSWLSTDITTPWNMMSLSSFVFGAISHGLTLCWFEVTHYTIQ